MVISDHYVPIITHTTTHKSAIHTTCRAEIALFAYMSHQHMERSSRDVPTVQWDTPQITDMPNLKATGNCQKNAPSLNLWKIWSLHAYCLAGVLILIGRCIRTHMWWICNLLPQVLANYRPLSTMLLPDRISRQPSPNKCHISYRNPLSNSSLTATRPHRIHIDRQRPIVRANLSADMNDDRSSSWHVTQWCIDTIYTHTHIHMHTHRDNLALSHRRWHYLSTRYRSLIAAQLVGSTNRRFR